MDVCDSLRPCVGIRARASFPGMKHGHRLRAGNRIQKSAILMKRRSARALYLTDYQERAAGVAVCKRELRPRD